MIKSLFAVLVLSMMGGQAMAEKCSFELVKDSVSIGWTGYKTTQKVGVNGSFKKFEIVGPTKAPTLTKLLTGIEVKIDKTSSDSGNPGRDKNISESFFALLAPKISGKIKSLSENDHTLVLALNLNGQTKDVNMTYDLKDDGAATATGNFDLLSFGGEKAYNSIHEKCLEVHKGADGISKTWSEFGLTLKGNVQKSCH